MQSIFDHKQTNKNRSLTHMLGVMALCTIAATGCNKQKDTKSVDATSESDAASTEITDEVAVESKTADQTIDSEPVIGCDDQIAVTQLIQSVRSSVSQQSQNLLKSYAERAEIPVELSSINSAVSSMLVDIASPVVVQPQNSDGMVTCKSSLSLTLPTKDMHQARTIYDDLGGETLQQRMSAQNLSLNNNMIVSSAFTYVVGMQGGQSTARVVGQPPILRSVADIIAKSKFKVASDAAHPAPPASPRTNPEPSSPAVISEPKQPQFPNDATATDANPKKEDVDKDGNKSDAANQTNSESSSSNSGKELDKHSKNETDTEFDVPTDDSMDMVIIEEEGTY